MNNNSNNKLMEYIMPNKTIRRFLPRLFVIALLLEFLVALPVYKYLSKIIGIYFMFICVAIFLFCAVFGIIGGCRYIKYKKAEKKQDSNDKNG